MLDSGHRMKLLQDRKSSNYIRHPHFPFYSRNGLLLHGRTLICLAGIVRIGANIGNYLLRKSCSESIDG